MSFCLVNLFTISGDKSSPDVSSPDVGDDFFHCIMVHGLGV